MLSVERRLVVWESELLMESAWLNMPAMLTDFESCYWLNLSHIYLPHFRLHQKFSQSSSSLASIDPFLSNLHRYSCITPTTTRISLEDFFFFFFIWRHPCVIYSSIQPFVSEASALGWEHISREIMTKIFWLPPRVLPRERFNEP